MPFEEEASARWIGDLTVAFFGQLSRTEEIRLIPFLEKLAFELIALMGVDFSRASEELSAEQVAPAKALARGVQLVVTPPERAARLVSWLELDRYSAQLVCRDNGFSLSDDSDEGDISRCETLQARGLMIEESRDGERTWSRTPIGGDVRNMLMVLDPARFRAA